MKNTEMKTWLKDKGAEIRELRTEMKNAMRSNSYSCGKLQNMLMYETSSFRHHHIAYGLLRGRKYEEIEQYTRKGNEPDWGRIESIMEDIRQGGES